VEEAELVERVAFWTTGENMNTIMRAFWEEGNIVHALRTTKEGLNMPTELAVKLFEGDMHLVGDTREGDHTLNLTDDEDDYQGTTVEEWFYKLKDRYIELQVDKMEYDYYLRKNMIRSLDKGDSEDIYDIEREVRSSAISLEKKKFDYLKQLTIICELSDHTFDEIEKEMYEKFDSNKFTSTSAIDTFRGYVEKNNVEVDIDEFIERMDRIDNAVVTEGEAGESAHGWINPKGTFYPCEYMGHINLAQHLAELGLSPGDEDDLENSGWIKLTSDNFIMRKQHKITTKQRNFIFDHFIEAGLKIIEFNGSRYKTIDELFEMLDRRSGRW